MAKQSSELKELVNTIPEKELQKLVLKAALKDKAFHNFLMITHFDKELGGKKLYDDAIWDLDILFDKK